MIDKLSPQIRIMLATTLSFIFFAGYQYFFVPPQVVDTETQQQTEAQQNTTTQAPSSDITSTSTAPVPTKTVKSTSVVITKVIADKYEVHIDKLGRISKFYLNEDRYTDEAGERIQLVDSELTPNPLEIRFADGSLNAQAFEVAYTTDTKELKVGEKGAKLTIKQLLDGVHVTKELTFYPNGNYDLHVMMSEKKEYFITPGFRPNVAVDSYTFHGSLIKGADDTLAVIDDGDATGAESFVNAQFVASSDRYYTTMMYNFEGGLNAVISPVYEDSPLLFVKGKSDLKLSGYIGPKDHRVLNAIEPKITDVIEYGFFTFISRPLFKLLDFLHSMFGNWGWSIVCMTLLIRVVMFPLTYKGMVSMNKMKALSPKVKELQAKYKGDKQKLNTHMMELYKNNGANPMGGCLPILLQIPVFFAIYRVLQNAIELKGAAWIFWVEDLAVMDPYYILPVAMGITMFLHQRITPTNFTDPMQEKIMRFLPLIFTFFFVTFPAGLTLYWFTNNLFSIGQQSYVNKIFAKGREEEKAAKKAKK